MSSEAVAAWVVVALTSIGLLAGFTAWMSKIYHLVRSTHEQLPQLWSEVKTNALATAKIHNRVTRLETRWGLDCDEDEEA